MIEFWRAGGSGESTGIAAAAAVEEAGWDGQMFMDSQSLGRDPYVMMAAWAMLTERLKLSTGVTNPLTRHPAVIASSIASVQAISGGRAVLGIGRGDSALAYLGHAPVRVDAFGRALEQLRTLLSGGEVAFGGAPVFGEAPSVETLSLGDRPATTRLKWLSDDVPKVPLDVAATGPKVIELTAPIADQMTFSVGAIPERLAWALDTARSARRKQGLGEGGISYGAQLVVICHTDVQAVRELASSFVAPLARFQVMQRDAAGPTSGSDSDNFATIRSGYDMNRHGHAVSDSHDKLGGAKLSWDFVSRFAIIGPPDHCTARLLELAALGIERFVVVGPGFHPEARGDGPPLFATEVIPAVRAALA